MGGALRKPTVQNPQRHIKHQISRSRTHTVPNQSHSGKQSRSWNLRLASAIRMASAEVASAPGDAKKLSAAEKRRQRRKTAKSNKQAFRWKSHLAHPWGLSGFDLWVLHRVLLPLIWPGQQLQLFIVASAHRFGLR